MARKTKFQTYLNLLLYGSQNQEQRDRFQPILPVIFFFYKRYSCLCGPKAIIRMRVKVYFH